ncbi:hypothetical protein CRYUN_Cryun35bG0018200 [Craigia yunnanensis]
MALKEKNVVIFCGHRLSSLKCTVPVQLLKAKSGFVGGSFSLEQKFWKKDYNLGDDVVNLIVLGVISWTTAFLLIRKTFFESSFEFCNRIVSTIHATLAVILVSLSVEDWSCPVCPLASNSSPKQRQALAVTVAYLIYDLICCLFDERVSLDNTVHHLVSIVGLGADFAYQKCGSEQIAALFITEISSPFLHARELLKELGYRDTDLNLAADVSFPTLQIQFVSLFWL